MKKWITVLLVLCLILGIASVSHAVSLCEGAHEWTEWQDVPTPAQPRCGDVIQTVRYCRNCLEGVDYGTRTVDHNAWGEYTVIMEPNCSSAGMEEAICQKCGATKTRPYGSATGQHKWDEWTTVKAATCTEEGLEERICHECKARDTRPISVISHSWGGWTEVKAPTCSAEGSQERTCSVCGAKDTQPVSATGNHTWGSWTVIKDANCIEDGSEERVCSVCGAKDTHPLYHNGQHVWGSWTIVKQPTCIEEGLEECVCKVCGEKETQPINRTGGHAWGDWTVAKAATCVQDGLYECACTVCGEKKTEPISATGDHAWSDWTVVKAATCVSDGMEERVCAGCGAKETGPLSATGIHTWSDWTVVKAATCITDGLLERACTVCGEKETQPDSAHGHHSWGAWNVIREATCIADGEMECVCVVCGEKKTEPISATGEHTWGRWNTIKSATCTEEGIKEHVCSGCGERETEIIPKEDHIWGDWEVISEPTDEADGERQRVCSECGKTETEAVYDPETALREGDTGAEVTALQIMLTGLDLEPGTLGTYDADTTASVRTVQEENGIPANGVATRATRDLINRAWQYARKVPLRNAPVKPGEIRGGRRVGESGRVRWISNGDGTHTRYTLGRKGITEPCQTEATELDDGSTVCYCSKCGYQYAVIVINGKPYNEALVARTTEWVGNGDGTHSRLVWVLDGTSRIRVKKITETAECTGAASDTNHGTYCAECHDYFVYQGHDTTLVSKEQESCGSEKETWYCNDCGHEFYLHNETGESCSQFTVTAVTLTPNGICYSYQCAVCGGSPAVECALDEAHPEQYGCTHYGYGGTVLSKSGECGDLHKEMYCANCGQNWTLIDRTRTTGCTAHDGFLGYTENNERALGCLHCGKIWELIPMTDEEIEANGDICPGHTEFDRTHDFVRVDEQCYEDCCGKHEVWVCKYCGLEDCFTEGEGTHPSTDTLLTVTCGLLEYGCPECGEVFYTVEGDECAVKDENMNIETDGATGETVLYRGCPECGKVWEVIPLASVDSVKADEDYYTEPSRACISEEGHDWSTRSSLVTYCTHIEALEKCNLCNATRRHIIPLEGEHPATDHLLWSDCEEECYGCPECREILEIRQTGKTHPSTDTILYTTVSDRDGERVTHFIYGCPVCEQEFGSIESAQVPEDEWSEWTYTGLGCHSRYWTKRPDVVQYEGCNRVNESYTTCDTCGGTYIESGRALAEHPIEIWNENKVVGVIPKGEHYTVLVNSDSPYVEYKGVRGYINWKEIQNLRAQYECTDPAGHDWQPVENMEPGETCTEISTLCECTRCGQRRWITELTGRSHVTTDAVIFNSCWKVMTGCTECGQVIQIYETGKECETWDAFLGFDETGLYAYLGCPVCGFVDWEIPLFQMGAEAWSEWVSNGNGTHSRHLLEYPTVVVTDACYPGDEAETVCGLCGGAYITRGQCIATEDIQVLDDLEYRFDERGATLVCIIPAGATYYVIENGDWALVEYNGQTGYIVNSVVNFTDGGEPEVPEEPAETEEEEVPCVSAEGHNWVASGEPRTYCTRVEEPEVCTLCGAERTRVTPADGDHPRTDELIWSDCEEEWYGCPECGDVFEIRPTGKTHSSTDTVLYTIIETENGERITYFILGCPECGQEFGHIESWTIPEDEWSEWTYTGAGSHSRYWTKRPDVVQYEGCSRVNESYTTCDTCGGTYIESGRALAEHPIEIWNENEVVGVIPKGEHYTVLVNSDSPYVEYMGIRGYINWKEIQNLTAQYECTDPAGHDWQPIDPEPSVTCTEISTLCECTRCGERRWITEPTGRSHVTTDAVIFNSCWKVMTGCTECGQVIQIYETGKECETWDAFLGFDETGNYAYLGCPECGFVDRELPLFQMGDSWSEWVSNGNGTHSRHLLEYPTVVVTDACYPANGTETTCGACGGEYFISGQCIATEDIQVLDDLENRFDEGGATVVCVIPAGATYTVIENGDWALVEYNGQTGYISNSVVNFVK